MLSIIDSGSTMRWQSTAKLHIKRLAMHCQARLLDSSASFVCSRSSSRMPPTYRNVKNRIPQIDARLLTYPAKNSLPQSLLDRETLLLRYPDQGLELFKVQLGSDYFPRHGFPTRTTCYRCVSVSADGNLARLKRMLFSQTVHYLPVELVS